MQPAFLVPNMSEIILPPGTSDDSGSFERLERFQSLESGQYGTSRVDIPEEAIQQGDTLLILSIDWVDGSAHTVHLRAHPRHYGRTATIKTVRADGSSSTNWREMKQHSFRIKDYLDKFEHEPDWQKIRAAELLALQGEVSDLQRELIETQSDPKRMQQIVEEGLAQARAKDDKITNQLPAVIDPAFVPPRNLGQALSGGVTAGTIKIIQDQAEHRLTVATIQSKWLQQKTEQISAKLARMSPYFSEQGAAALAQVHDVTRHVSKIKDGVESLHLYTGEDVYVEPVRSGVSAPADQPLTVVQQKLVMLEELAVFDDVEVGDDHRALDRFLDLLRIENGLVDQIFPTSRCVICMASSRHNLDYQDPWESQMRNAENKKVFLLVRDGENINLVLSPVESHLGSSRLFPTKSEVDHLFTGSDGEQITFDSLQYTRSLGDFEKQALHYKRLLILLCGLDHRLKLFGDFYDGVQDFSFISMDFQRQHFRFLHNDDESQMLTGGPARVPVTDWLKQANRFLTSGSRVLGLWNLLITEDTSPGGVKVSNTFKGTSDVRIAYKDGIETCVSIPLTVRGQQAVNVKVMPRKYRSSRERPLMPYLVLDAVDPEDLRAYIHDRASRVQHLSYIRLFKSALATIEAERAQEQPSRDVMLQALVDGRVLSTDDAPKLVDKAVRLWRAANRGEALPAATEQLNSKHWTSLFDLMFLLVHAGNDQLPRIQNWANEQGLNPVRLVVTGKAQLVLYCAPADHERDDRLTPHVWLHRITLRLGKRGISETARVWKRLPRLYAGEELLRDFEADQDVWLKTFSGFSNPDKKQDAFEKCEAGIENLRELLSTPAAFSRAVSRFYQLRPSLTKYVKKNGMRTGQVVEPAITIPIGITWGKRYGKEELAVLALRCSSAVTFLAAIAPTEELRNELKQLYISVYENELNARNRFDEYPTRAGVGESLSLVVVTPQEALRYSGEIIHAPDAVKFSWCSTSNKRSPSLDELLCELHDPEDGKNVWLAGGLTLGSDHGLDGLFGNVEDLARRMPGQLAVYSFPEEAPYSRVFMAMPDEATEHTKFDFTSSWSRRAKKQWLLPEEWERIRNDLEQDKDLVSAENLPESMPQAHNPKALGIWYELRAC
ncbi:hypothetical protein SAMN05216605_121132 [Pseudomonas abietaniphila]|uniref:Uncharacterized protein n=2 Tax=Pseudomonas abietaniphila TaxID=89065 RepID=A0A1G8R1F5_9PSED|nr:hypothetical protein SAMN05216605_121132 [Pseudomonas abietaniphila]